MTSTIRAAGRWLPYPVADAGVRLYCLPHAGGSASSYHRWVGQLEGVAVCPVQPPGRETRREDDPHYRMDTLTDELADVVLAEHGPYAIFGHSLGALVGFELIQEIRRRGGPQPVHFLVSGCPAPQWLTPDDPLTAEGELTDERIVSLLRILGGTPELFLSDPRVLRMILPPLRADLTVKKEYAYAVRPPLDVPITAISGTDDPRAAVESMAAWREQTVRRFRMHSLDGGHFAVLEQSETTLRHFADALRPWAG
jgi:surfactin synthase thioesterase subunit